MLYIILKSEDFRELISEADENPITENSSA